MESIEKTRKTNLILYGLGIILLVYFTMASSEDRTSGFILLLAYIPLFIFTRYLQNHGGMGWMWPAWRKLK